MVCFGVMQEGGMEASFERDVIKTFFFALCLCSGRRREEVVFGSSFSFGFLCVLGVLGSALWESH